jgi:hypothetical protein
MGKGGFGWRVFTDSRDSGRRCAGMGVEEGEEVGSFHG